MRKLLSLFLFGVALLLLSVAPLAAQNSVDVLGGPQPADAPMPASWSTTSNANPTPMDITTSITANFVFDSNGGASPTDFPAATRGQICLADTRDLGAPTLFAQIAANCQIAGGVALLLIRDSAVTAPSNIPVFTISTSNGDFLRNTVKFNATTGISNFQIRINVAKATPPSNPTGQHNCPDGQAVAAYVGPGEPRSTPPMRVCVCPRGQDRLSSPA